jgi:hypothetical protein
MLLHVWIIASNREHVWQGYHIDNVNAYTSGLKTWMVRFKGVATKYLDSYLGWRRMIDGKMEAAELLAEHDRIALTLGRRGPKYGSRGLREPITL